MGLFGASATTQPLVDTALEIKHKKIPTIQSHIKHPFPVPLNYRAIFPKRKPTKNHPKGGVYSQNLTKKKRRVRLTPFRPGGKLHWLPYLRCPGGKLLLLGFIPHNQVRCPVPAQLSSVSPPPLTPGCFPKICRRRRLPGLFQLIAACAAPKENK